MDNLSITFCGHRRINDEQAIENTVMEIISNIFSNTQQDTIITFYCGGYGMFDNIASRTIEIIKSKYSERKIEKFYVTPYIGGVNEENNKSMLKYYDNIIYPPLETVPPRYAIIRRNEWMVDNADIVIAHVLYGWGGAARTLRYAKRKKKAIIEIR